MNNEGDPYSLFFSKWNILKPVNIQNKPNHKSPNP